MGSVFVYAGLTGRSVLASIQAIVSGKAPNTAGKTVGISGSSGASGGGSPGGSTAVSGGSNKALLFAAAAQHGWTSQGELSALDNLEMHEAGYSATARNSSSGAFGIAQAYGHGNANTAAADGTNEYGGYGLSDAQAKAANSGDAGWQSVWMCNYIQQTYGSPSAAWAQYFNHSGGVGSY